MQTTIYYFSGTGNSLKVSKEISNKIGDCTLKSIVKEIKNEKIICLTESAGFVFPLYYQSFPRIVMKFIEKIDLSKADYIFAAVTRGTTPTGGVLNHLKKLLNEKNKILNSGFYINMPNNEVILFNGTDEKKISKIFDKAEKRIDTIIQFFKDKKNKIQFEPLLFLRNFRHNYFLKKLKDSYKDFYTTERCNSCKICVKICPINNIILENNKPVWGNQCEECEACINYCPVKAIEHGKTTSGKRRYINPEIKINELFDH